LRYKKGVIVKIGTEVTAIEEGSEIYYDKRAGYTMLLDSVSHTVIQENDVVVVL
jgi:co-chaperonin GroES (HSP10)